MGVSGISSGFPLLSQSPGQVPHVLLTRSPLHLPQSCDWLGAVRLACVKHAASVRPEPGSNSPSRSCPGCPGAIILKSRRPGFLIPRANWHEDGHWFVVRSSASCIDRCALRSLGVRPHSLLAFLYSVFKVHPRRWHASPKSRWCGPPLGEVRIPGSDGAQMVTSGWIRRIEP